MCPHCEGLKHPLWDRAPQRRAQRPRQRMTTESTTADAGAIRCRDRLCVRRTHLDLFSGIGGFALAAERTGWQTVGFCEVDEYASRILKRHWPSVPNYGDIRNIRGVRADLVTGGFPCQPFSTAGQRRGASDDRALWPEMCRVIEEAKRLGCLLKMFLESSAWNSTECYLTWSASVTPSGRWLFRLVPSMQSTIENESGYWPTPCAGGSHWGGTWVELGGSKNWMRNHPLGKGQVNPRFWEWMLGYPKDFTVLDAEHSETPSSLKLRK